MSRAEQAADQAARWVLAQEEESWSEADQAEFEDWLAETDGNRTAYLRLRHSWREADRISAQSRSHPELVERGEYRPPSRWYVPAGIAASIALALGGTYLYRPELLQPAAEQVVGDSYATRVGSRKVIALSDGSKVELNTASRVRTAVLSKRREVWLDEGEAFFEVAHKNGQLFIVHAGNRQITVLGTKFSVRRDDNKVTVAVLEGRVRVDEIEQGQAVRSSVIVGGDIAIARGPATLVASRSEQKVEDALAWRQGMLSFDQSNLGEIAAEFNRYNARKLVVVDPQAASLRIGGMFPSNDPGAFVRLLRDAYGLQVEETPTKVRIGT
jgi:transmembrane sensor